MRKKSFLDLSNRETDAKIQFGSFESSFSQFCRQNLHYSPHFHRTMATKTTPLAAAATATASSFMSIAAACSSSAAAAIASSRLDDDDDDDSTMMTMMMMKQRLSLMVRTRPSTAMAEEFLFGGGNSKNIKVSWKSLPQRLRTLCNRLQNWVRRRRLDNTFKQEPTTTTTHASS